KDVDQEVDFFHRSASILRERLGAVLFQLPPNFPKDVDRLRHLLDLVGQPEKAALEFRHASWMDDEVVECLSGYGAALCTADTESAEGEIVRTGPQGYLRLRKPDYSGEELRRWAKNVEDANWTDAFVFFKHADEGAGPEMAAAFQALVTPG
ncbi:MAG: DUF72 domain-containing protein, partial [Rhodothermales bacterium]|nr:DUF72 domain-containing protein [Rhodothermales bacterium]